MSDGRKATSSAHRSSTKKQRRAINLETLLEIIMQNIEGSKVQTIVNSEGFDLTTISTILIDEEKVKETAKTIRDIML